MPVLKKYKIDVIEGEAKLLPNSQVEINGDTHEASDILLCTGSSPAIPPIPEWNLIMWLIQAESWKENLYPIIWWSLGGGVIGCEFACMHASVGVPVTVLEAMPEICPNLDAEFPRACVKV